MGLQQAYMGVSLNHLQALCDIVRTRILDLALSLEAISPEVGEPGGPVPDASSVQPIVNNIYCGNAVVAIGASGFTQITMPAQGDVAGLIAALAGLGIENADLNELERALHEDVDSGEGRYGNRIGPRVEKWLGHLAVKAGSAAGSTAVTQTVEIAFKLLAAHMGIHT